MTKNDVHEAARLMVLYHGTKAPEFAIGRADEVLELGHISDFTNWMRIAKLAERTVAELTSN